MTSPLTRSTLSIPVGVSYIQSTQPRIIPIIASSSSALAGRLISQPLTIPSFIQSSLVSLNAVNSSNSLFPSVVHSSWERSTPSRTLSTSTAEALQTEKDTQMIRKVILATIASGVIFCVGFGSGLKFKQDLEEQEQDKKDLEFIKNKAVDLSNLVNKMDGFFSYKLSNGEILKKKLTISHTFFRSTDRELPVRVPLDVARSSALLLIQNLKEYRFLAIPNETKEMLATLLLTTALYKLQTQDTSVSEESLISSQLDCPQFSERIPYSTRSITLNFSDFVLPSQKKLFLDKQIKVYIFLIDRSQKTEIVLLTSKVFR